MSTGRQVQMRRLKYAATINDEALTEETEPDFELQYVDIGNVDSSGEIHEIATHRFEAAPSRARRIVRDGDVIISTVRTYLQAIAPIENPPDNLIVSTGFAVVRPSPQLDRHFCKYAIREPEFLAEVERRSVGISYPAINASDLGDIRIPLPPLLEQRAIADFLDRETARLDALVAAKERWLELLAEKRRALITRAVTRGLNPAAPLRDSGHPWLGEIPAHWTAKHLKHVSILFGRIGFRGYSTEDLVGEGEGAISMSPSNMAAGVVNLDKCTWLSWDKYNESPEIQVQAGDVVMVKTGSTLGKVAFVESVTTPMTVNPQLMIFKEIKCSKRFLFYYLFSDVIQNVIPLHNTGSTIPTMSQEDISELPFPCPPPEEQEAIVAHISAATAKLDALRAATERTISLLRERRAALIAAAVTGKLKVD